MLGFIYFKDDKNAVPTVKSSIMKGALSLGMIVGQLVFGVLGDALGRRKIYDHYLRHTDGDCNANKSFSRKCYRLGDNVAALHRCWHWSW